MSKTMNKVEILDGNIAKLDLTVDAKIAQDAYNRVVVAYSKQAKVPGFRQGKVPKAILEKHVGVEAIQHKMIDEVFQEAFYKAVSENSLNLAMQPYIESYEYNEGEDLKLVVKVELKPEVTLPDYKNVEVSYEEFKNDDKALEFELEALQKQLATTADVVGRKTKSDDLVVFDFDGYANDKPIVGGKAEGYTLDLANSNFIPGFAEGLVGHDLNEEFTIDVTFPEDYHSEELKGAKAQFKIKIHAIKERILPELDDEFAKKVSGGKFETLDALKEDIKKHLENTQEAENIKRKEFAIVDYVVENSKIDIQKTMIAREIEAVRAEAQQRAMAQGLKWDELLKSEDAQKIDEQMEIEAVKRIKNSLVVEKIAENEKIDVTQQDLTTHINELAMAYGPHAKQLMDEIKNNPNSYVLLTQQIITKKVAQILLENNKFTTKERQ